MKEVLVLRGRLNKIITDFAGFAVKEVTANVGIGTLSLAHGLRITFDTKVSRELG